MEWLHIISFITVASLLVISPGPNGVLIAKTVSISSKQAGFVNILGFMAAFYIHGTLSILGISIVILQSAQLFFVFKMLGALYLCWIGIKSLISAWQYQQRAEALTSQNRYVDNDKKAFSFSRDFSEGFLTNMLNPKVSMFYLAAFPQFLSVNADIYSAFMLVTLHALINLIWFSLIIMLFIRLKRFGQNDKLQRWLQSITGVVLISFGLKLATLDNKS